MEHHAGIERWAITAEGVAEPHRAVTLHLDTGLPRVAR
jgi:hypothetical protein